MAANISQIHRPHSSSTALTQIKDKFGTAVEFEFEERSPSLNNDDQSIMSNSSILSRSEYEIQPYSSDITSVSPPSTSNILSDESSSVSSINISGRDVWHVLRPFVIGATSAITASAIVQPLDMIKVGIHSMGEGSGENITRNPITVGYRYWKNNGYRSFYRGFSSQIARQCTYGCVRLGTFRSCTRFEQNRLGLDDPSDLPVLNRGFCAAMAAFCGSLAGCPADTCLVRMQYDSYEKDLTKRRNYRNFGDAFFRIIKSEGIAVGLYAGYPAFYVRCLAMNLGAFMSYDPSVRFFKTHGFDSEKDRLGKIIPAHWLAAVFSAFVAGTLSTPFDFVKTRLQKQYVIGEEKQLYNGVIDCFVKCYRWEGLKCFFQSYRSNLLLVLPHNAICWVTLHYLDQNLKIINL